MNKQYWEAIEAYSQAIAIEDMNTLFLTRRGLCYTLIGDIDKMKIDMISAMNAMDHGKEIPIELIRLLC